MQKAKDKERDDYLRQEYLVMLPFMVEKRMDYMSFRAYVDRSTGKSIDWRNDAEIIAELEELHGRNLI